MRIVFVTVDSNNVETLVTVDENSQVHKCRIQGVQGSCPGNVLASSLEIGDRICPHDVVHKALTITDKYEFVENP